MSAKPLEQIKKAILELTFEQRADLAEWMLGTADDDDWDRQMRADAAAGKFDKIIREVDEAAKRGELRDMP
jgi:hypothetical protein